MALNLPKVDKIIEAKVDDEEEALNFQFDFINYVTGIPKKQLMLVKPYGTSKVDELSIQWVFETISFLLCVPQYKEEEIKPLERIADLYFIDKINLDEAILKDANFIDYKELKSVQTAFNKLKDGSGRFEYLNLIMAIMYRPKETTGKLWWKKQVIEEYDTDKVKARAKWFDEITMDVVWNALFFFTLSKTNLLRNIEASFRSQVGEALKH